MSGDYTLPEASATFVEPTGQVEYVLTWDKQFSQVWMSGTNLNDGIKWGETLVQQPERFGPLTTRMEFFAWVAKFLQNC